MRRFFAVAMSSVVALVSFAGVANASATIDLVWLDMTDPACTDDGRRDCPRLGTTISSVAVTDNVTLGVIITAGPGGVVGGGVSVNYGDALYALSVVDFRSMTTTQPAYLPSGLGATSNIPPYIDNINATAAPFLNPPVGMGLPPGVSAYLGTVTFHKDHFSQNFFEISVGVDGPGNTDGIGDLDYNLISDTTTFNSAFMGIDGDPPWGCTSPDNPAMMEIEVNALRAGGKTIVTSPGDTTRVTAKARILKGTAPSGTAIDTTLTIEVWDGDTSLDTEVAPNQITLGVGKGGKGATLLLSTEHCESGHLTFVANFRGLDVDGETCEGERKLIKACR
jgi:hypothetical protein